MAVLGPGFARIVIASLVVALAFVWRPASAAGWQEIHQTSDDVRIEVGTDGTANVRHHLRYRVVAGQFDAIDLVGVDPSADVWPEAVLRAEKGSSEIPVRVEPAPGAAGTLRIFIDEPKGLRRGAYLVDVTYRLDLVATRKLVRDGAMWKLEWTAPLATEGRDGARVMFDLPTAPTEPRLASSAESTTTLATLRRTEERDELELVRAHVPRGEAPVWAVRIDPKAFPLVTAPELRPATSDEPETRLPFTSSGQTAVVVLAFAAFACALATLLRTKRRAVREAAALRGARARPLVSFAFGKHSTESAVADLAVAVAYGVATSLALAFLLWAEPLVGAVLVAFAMALASHRAPLPVHRPRGPGVFRPLPERRVFVAVEAPLPTDILDMTTLRGRLVLLLLAAVGAGIAFCLSSTVPQVTIAVGLTFAAIVPVFVTGTRAQLTPTPMELASRVLRPTRDVLASMLDLSQVDLVVIGRVVGDREVDEVRLACAPRDRTPGLRAIELALATPRAGGGRVASPEVFVRVNDGSAAAERVGSVRGGGVVVPSRSMEERVFRFVPEEPTPRSAATLVAELTLALEDRRVTDRSSPQKAVHWRGKERRRRAHVAAGVLDVVPRAAVVST